LKSAASEAGGEPVDQDGDVVEGESGLKDSADGFFEHVATPNLAAGGFEPLERDGLLVGEVLRSFQQRPACQGSREFPRCDHGNSSPCGVAGERRAERVEGVAVAAHAVAVAGHGEDAGVVE
jgi:hypothetical protein